MATCLGRLRPRPVALTGSAPTDLRALVAERRVGERLQRVVQRRELVRDPKKTFAVVETLVQSVQLGGQAVEPFKDRVQLAVVKIFRLHSH